MIKKPRKRRVKMLLIREVAEKTGAAASSIRVWLREGQKNPATAKFPGAKLEETELGPVWRIPESDIKNFKARKPGRPAGSKNKSKKSNS